MQTQQYLVTSPLTSKHNLNKRAEVTICVLQHSQISCETKSQFSKCTKIQSTPQLPYKACLYNLYTGCSFSCSAQKNSLTTPNSYDETFLALSKFS